MKKILITGGTGFIGANLTHRLVSLGYRPTLFIRKESNLWRLQAIKGKIDFIESDLFDLKNLTKLISKVNPTHVFHLATYGANQRKQNDIGLTFQNNILGTVNLLNVCCKNGFEYFVNTGSSSEYGIKKRSMKETDLLEPTNFYGVTKVANTLAVKVFSQQYKLPIVTLRPFSPYGYWEDKSRFIPYLIFNAIKNKLCELSNPNYARDFIFIDDMIDVYLYFLDGKKFYGEIFNIGSGKQTSLGNVVDIVAGILHMKLKTTWKSHQSNQQEPKIWQADTGKTKKTLNWKPNKNISQGLKKTIIWFKKNQNLYIDN